MPVRRQFPFDRNEFLVTEMKEEIPAGSVVSLHLHFNGSLVNDIQGLYKSTYINTQSQKQR